MRPENPFSEGGQMATVHSASAKEYAFEAGGDAMFKLMVKYMEEKSLFSMAHGKPIYSMSLADYKALHTVEKKEPIYTPADYVEVHNVCKRD